MWPVSIYHVPRYLAGATAAPSIGAPAISQETEGAGAAHTGRRRPHQAVVLCAAIKARLAMSGTGCGTTCCVVCAKRGRSFGRGMLSGFY